VSEIEKVAILLIALGPQKAQRILDKLGPDELMPIVQAMRKLKKITPEAREQVLTEVNGILEDLAASAFPGSEFDPASPELDAAPPELPPSPSARDILEQVQDVLPDKVEPDAPPPTEIDWGAAGFDFGSGNRGKKRDDEEDGSPPERGSSR
jgi:hypothetical protein